MAATKSDYGAVIYPGEAYAHDESAMAREPSFLFPGGTEMTKRGITYDQLAAKLSEIGVKVDPHVLRNKVARGGFSAMFFVQCLVAMGCGSLRLTE